MTAKDRERAAILAVEYGPRIHRPALIAMVAQALADERERAAKIADAVSALAESLDASEREQQYQRGFLDGFRAAHRDVAAAIRAGEKDLTSRA